MSVLAGKFTDQTLARLWEMSRFTTTPDGYPTRTIPDGGSRGTDATTSTEAAALYGLPEASNWSAWTAETCADVAVPPDGWEDPRRFRADPLGDAITDVVSKLGFVAQTLADMEKTLGYILNAGSALGTACNACQGSRRCQACDGAGWRCARCERAPGVCPVCNGSGRKSTVELCTGCNLPIPGRLHRIDGAPYHDYKGEFDGRRHGNCYKKVQRERRLLAGLPALTDEIEEETVEIYGYTGDARKDAPLVCSHGHRCCTNMDTGSTHEHWHSPATCPACTALDVHVSTGVPA